MITEAIQRVTGLTELLSVLIRARLLAPLRPDKYARYVETFRRHGMSPAIGISLAAVRCPDRLGLVDEIGSLTWKELDERAGGFAAALQALPGEHPTTVGVLCRNHRGFLDAVAGSCAIGADVVLLNTSFAAPALAEVVEREKVDVLIYDDEFAPSVDAVTGVDPARRIVAWSDTAGSADGRPTVDQLIAAHSGQRPAASSRTSKMILLTSGTTGTPKGARQSASGPAQLLAILGRIPWRAEETTVVVAPMFHAWGFMQLMVSSLLACTVVTRRRFDPEATLALVDEHRATGLSVVPMMFDRIMDLPADVLDRYSGRSLRFASASGSRMRSDVVLAFMNRFGDIVYNNYNATEAGLIATATPADLRAAPETAGQPAVGTELRILDDRFAEVPTGETGQIFVRNSTQFGGYTSGATKNFRDGFMASGDLGRLDEAGRLYVVGRDDDMIVSGGENIYPIEVEKSLVTHPDVAEASVIGIDDDQYGQRLVAFVVLTPGSGADADALKDHVRRNLANYKVPRDVHELSELPRNATGKILRRELLELAEGRGGGGD